MLSLVEVDRILIRSLHPLVDTGNYCSEIHLCHQFRPSIYTNGTPSQKAAGVMDFKILCQLVYNGASFCIYPKS